jgi:putative transposase
MGHPPRIPVWLRWEQSVIYFVTICVANRRHVLANETAFVAFQHAAARLRDWTVLAGIIMPDHLHVIVAPTEDREAKVGNFSAAIKRWMRREMQETGGADGKRSACPTIETRSAPQWRWQPGCFDRLLRSDESLHDKWLYVQENPVRAGLVKRWEDWPYRYEFNDPKS